MNEIRQGYARDGISKKDVTISFADAQTANRLCEEQHYLKRKRVGRIAAYSVFWKDEWMGVLIFARPMVCHTMFGYSPSEIVELARVWFKTNPKNLGSCAIRMACKRIGRDWPGTRAIVSWCDTSRFDGALYKATGFRFMGLSRIRAAEASAARHGGGRPGRRVQDDRLTAKQKWLITLEEKHCSARSEQNVLFGPEVSA